MSSPAASPPVPRRPPGGTTAFRRAFPYIVGNEGAERFSFYGMRQILYIYLTSLFIGFAAESTIAPDPLAEAKVHATQMIHLFNAGVYLFPMIGAILADRLLGNTGSSSGFRSSTAPARPRSPSAVSAGSVGNLGLAQMAIFAGLILVALGSGGIKPCVSANVGDQFTAKNAHLVTRIFQIFYFIINFGSFFASLLTPWLFKHCGPGGRLRRAGHADGPGDRGVLARPAEIRARAAAARRAAGPARFSRLVAPGHAACWCWWRWAPRWPRRSSAPR